jgi:quercetin dioxygenase-like cupin family protein
VPHSTAFWRVWQGSATEIKLPGITLRVVKSGAETGGHVAIFEEITEPGSGPPLHRHNAQTEVFHVREGQYRFHLDGEYFELGPGDCAVVRPGQTHAFKNIGDSDGRFIFELFPALDATGFFVRLSQAGPDDDVAALFAEYQGEQVGPSDL